MSTLRKLKKLQKDPKAFFWDLKINPLKKIQAELVAQSNLITKSNTEFSKVKKTINQAFAIVNNDFVNLKPLVEEFDFDFILQGLSRYNINAVYIKPVDAHLKPVLCVLHKHRNDFFKKFLSYLYSDNIELAYKHKGEAVQATSVSELLSNISSLRQVDIRLSVNNKRLIPGQTARIWLRLEFVEEFDDHYMFPAANLISRKLWKHTQGADTIFSRGLVDYWSILPLTFEQKIDFDIDLVFTWVNSDDPDWQEMYREYKPDFDSDANSTSRFLSRDELKYALRSWEKYGSFIRKIFVVSNCAPPSWLDVDHEKIEWVYHESIMPQSVLPTFSSHAIETSLYRIPGLSNYFIYSNDDFLLVKPTTADNFYYHNGIAKLRLENWGNVNGEITEGEPDYLNAARNSNRLLEQTFGKSTTQLHTHSPQSMRIDVMQEMYELYADHFDRTMANKFRSIDDIAVTGYLYHHYAMLSGRALQSTEKTELVQQNHNFKHKLRMVIDQNTNKEYAKLPLSVCINDGANSHLNEEWNIEVINFLDNLFPEPSSFEKL